MADNPSPHQLLAEGAPVELVRRAVAEFALKNAARIRAIARTNLTTATRAVHDSEDVLSSVLRRLDVLVASGKLYMNSEAELWALIKVIASNTAVSRTRLMERARELLTEGGPAAFEFLKRLNSSRSDEEATLLLHRMAAAIKDPKDRHIFLLRYRGASHAAIGDLIGISEDACRHRWQKIRHELNERFKPESP